MLPRWIRAANAGMAVLLLYAVAVQYNDPDPLRWAALYGSAAVVSGVLALRALPAGVPGIVAAIALAWCAWLASRVIGQQPVWEEEGREMLGLLIAGGWMALDAAQLRRAQQWRAGPTRR